MSGSFLENQYNKGDNPFELGPLAKKIKASRQEKIKAGAQKIVNDIVKPTSPYVQFDRRYSVIYEGPKNGHEATNGEIAESLAELSYEDISDIVDRAYQIKSMKANELKDK